jgi:tetratricopeptide (TPR) repeat protein
LKGLSVREKGGLDRYVQYITQAISLDPKFALYYQNRAKAYRALGKNDLAYADKQKAHELREKES